MFSLSFIPKKSYPQPSQLQLYCLKMSDYDDYFVRESEYTQP